MNIASAKRIPLHDILAILGYQPTKERGNDLFYLSPWRAESTASLHVSLAQNLWYDHGEGEGGDVIALVRRYLGSQQHNNQVADALRWLKNMTGYVPVLPPELLQNETPFDEGALQLNRVVALRHPALIRYLETRGIPLTVASAYLKELRIYNRHTTKSFFALGFKNEDGGYELRNPYFKGCVKVKTVTFIRGTVPKPDGVHLFEGVMDFLSAVTRQEGRPFQDDVIVLNSLSCTKDASAYIKNYGYLRAHTWFDNDEAGRKATKAFAEFFKGEDRLQHQAMNATYAPYKDVNAWHTASLEL